MTSGGFIALEPDKAKSRKQLSGKYVYTKYCVLSISLCLSLFFFTKLPVFIIIFFFSVKFKIVAK